VHLGHVADVVSGVGFPKEMQGRVEGEVPVFKVGDISNALKSGTRHLRRSPNHLSKEAAKHLSKNLMPAGTTVFAKIGEGLKLNRRGILAQPSLVDNNVMGLIPKAGVVAPDYLYYFMQTVDLGALSQATAIPSVRKSDVVEIRIPLCALGEQENVVAEIEKQFSRLDEAVAGLQRVKANLKRYKAAVLKAAVEGHLVPTEADLASREGRNYETGAELLQRILETRRQWQGKGKYKEPAAPDTTDLPELPEGWVWSTFSAAAERVTVGHVGPMKDEYRSGSVC
jgi:type I restriction enzyme S subunit